MKVPFAFVSGVSSCQENHIKLAFLSWDAWEVVSSQGVTEAKSLLVCPWARPLTLIISVDTAQWLPDPASQSEANMAELAFAQSVSAVVKVTLKILLCSHVRLS